MPRSLPASCGRPWGHRGHSEAHTTIVHAAATTETQTAHRTETPGQLRERTNPRHTRTAQAHNSTRKIYLARMASILRLYGEHEKRQFSNQLHKMVMMAANALCISLA